MALARESLLGSPKHDWLENAEKLVYPDLSGAGNCGIFYVEPMADKRLPGNAFITNYRFRFEITDLKFAAINSDKTIDIPLGTISKITKIGGQKRSQLPFGASSMGISVAIACKDFNLIRISFSGDCSDLSSEKIIEYTNARRDFVNCLTKYAFVKEGPTKEWFAFQYNKQFSFNGWTVYDPITEWKRQGAIGNEKDVWKVCSKNSAYLFASTYPKLFVIPISEMADSLLEQVGEFRSKQRIPVLSWYHPTNKATITRSSQPLSGVTMRKSSEDVAYLGCIGETNARHEKMLVVDCRPDVNAKANMARGGGYETLSNYSSVTQFHFMDIKNIHAMRQSKNKLEELIMEHRNAEDKWFSLLSKSEWLHNTALILTGANYVAHTVDTLAVSVLVHCSDGWDRTAQLTSLAMLMLDPYYRTIRGFEVLIEKEWCSMGHKFADRIGHLDGNVSNERSPIFLQFIDAVWQIANQFKCAFEFNEQFLLTIMQELYACRFGTFLFNCEKERQDHKLSESTTSLWSYIEEDLPKYTNPLYCSDNIRYLKPNTAVRTMKLWKKHYLAHSPDALPDVSDALGELEVSRIMIDLQKIFQTDKNKLQSELQQKQRSNITPTTTITPPHASMTSSIESGDR